MLITRLIPWLKKHGIEVVEERLHPDSSRALIFSTNSPALPFGEGRHVWCVLVIDGEQTEVSESEVESVLRHCWHGELEIPRDFDADPESEE
jgi:hypothetical protein